MSLICPYKQEAVDFEQRGRGKRRQRGRWIEEGERRKKGRVKKRATILAPVSIQLRC